MRARGDELLGLVERWCISPQARGPSARRAQSRARRWPHGRAELSVTQIETLVRDAYAIYAKKVLRSGGRSTRFGRPPDFPDPRNRHPQAFMERLHQRHAGTTCRSPTEARAVMLVQCRRRGPGRGGALARHAPRLAGADRALRRLVPGRARPKRRDDGAAGRAGGQGRRWGIGDPGRARSPWTARRPTGSTGWRTGGAAIYDYKTGAPPSRQRQIRAGIQPAAPPPGEDSPGRRFRAGLVRWRRRIGAYLGLTGVARRAARYSGAR